MYLDNSIEEKDLGVIMSNNWNSQHNSIILLLKHHVNLDYLDEYVTL